MPNKNSHLTSVLSKKVFTNCTVQLTKLRQNHNPSQWPSGQRVSTNSQLWYVQISSAIPFSIKAGQPWNARQKSLRNYSLAKLIIIIIIIIIWIICNSYTKCCLKFKIKWLVQGRYLHRHRSAIIHGHEALVPIWWDQPSMFITSY